ncbi:MAG TPA: DUF11 domain-containing protein [Anaerolineales bacterium]|nr:DUF11 domain-containing protein [Anaerolineales bacterium]
MNRPHSFRHLLIRMIGIFSVIIGLGSATPVLAAQGTSDISVTVVADKSKIKVGEEITYTVTMTNPGPDDAFFVDVRFGLPDQLGLVSMTCDLGISPDTPFCEYSSLLAGETVVSTLVATPNPNAPTHDRNLKLTADILFEVDCSFDPNCTFDPDLGNNLASVSTKLIGKLAQP